MSSDFLYDILCCPQCRSKLHDHQGIPVCIKCNMHPEQSGRMVDFRPLTPKLPLHFARYTQQLHEAAGHAMSDVPVDWRVQKVVEMAKTLEGGGVCLEIGGADGPMTRVLESMYSTVITIDFAESFLRRIEAKTEKTICLCGDAHFLPIVDKSVDLVICSEVLEHVSIPTQLLLEIRRVLKPGGKCILSVPHEAPDRRMRRWRAADFLAERNSHITFFNGITLNKLLFRMGFNIIQFHYLSEPAKLTVSLRRLYFLLRRKLHPSYLLCMMEIMEDPDVYWSSFASVLGAEKVGHVIQNR